MLKAFAVVNYGDHGKGTKEDLLRRKMVRSMIDLKRTLFNNLVEMLIHSWPYVVTKKLLTLCETCLESLVFLSLPIIPCQN